MSQISDYYDNIILLHYNIIYTIDNDVTISPPHDENPPESE